MNEVRAWAIVLPVCAFLAASPAAQAKQPLTVAAFRAKANAICAAAHKYQLPTPTLPITTREVVQLDGDSFRHFQSFVNAWKRLDPPGEFASTNVEVIADLDRALRLFDTKLTLVEHGTLTQDDFIQFLDRSPVVEGNPEAPLWRRLGVETCLNP